MVQGHNVDVPVTDLDELEDDFDSTEALDPSVLRDDFEGDDNNTFLFSQESLTSKLISKFKSLFGGQYASLPKNHTLNGIELRNTNTFADLDNDSFDFSDDEFISTRRELFQTKDTIFEKISFYTRSYLSYVVIFALLIAVIILGVLLGAKHNNEDDGKVYSKLANKPKFSNGTDFFYPTTLLISLDGFHPHYISKELTPVLHNFFIQGHGAPYMTPSFPSSTFPNHWTIATGLYPGDHGIVGNTFYDAKSKKQFINVIPQLSLDPGFWGGEPIWSTAEFQGLRSAIHMFPGSEVRFKKGNPSEFDKYNGTETLQSKTDKILGWLDRDISKRPELMIAYVPTIDSVGHQYGIKGKELEKALQEVDSFIGSVTEGIKQRNATDLINLIVVSDHGMASTSEKRLIYLDDLVNTTKIEHTDGWPLFGLTPFAEYSVEEVFDQLKANFKEDQGYKIYLREDLPKEWHFTENPKYIDRVSPIWVIPDVGYAITTHEAMERNQGKYSPKGVHGYDNTEVLMRAIFLGDGPYFKSKANNGQYKLKPFQNTEIYNILCDTLNLQPAANNGTVNLVSSGNFLAEDWVDDLNYPNVNYKIEGTLGKKPTYDELYRGKKPHKTTTLEQGEATTDETVDQETKESVKPTITTATTEIKENTVTETATDTKEVEKPKQTKHKGFWESLEDFGEDLLEDAEDALEDAVDAVKGAIDSSKSHKGKNGDH
ncbi:hypothetical protein WICPIJ_001593 [Wickerhamomyces pijperi]|uniref:Uncharacterized protein n=1 Tax=Wickerhamomyces pijperi TaxID=599730 RepID=A0A9P8QBE1_WICPI|nr:hypothetical protein WICPIJ_001593 [Wickerhamomyces pijperi]